ncbi:permease prefix domain 1-containing protein [Amphibacillus marinus]|nr:permease prefix domain 1-containing protein [Amphibacillus marinus]
METILMYLDSMFEKLPNTEQVIEVKQELKISMQDKYEALKHEGKSENEAIGTVIAEFGNIDEIIEALNVTIEETNDDADYSSVSDQEINHFIEVNNQSAHRIGIGVAIIIAGVATFLLFNRFVQDFTQWNNSFFNWTIVGLVFLFLAIAVGTGLFIYDSSQTNQFEAFGKSIVLTPEQQMNIKDKLHHYSPSYVKGIIIGVSLCIFAPLQLIVVVSFNSNYAEYATAVLLVIVAIAVYLFVYFGVKKEGYNRLLLAEEYDAKKNKEHDKVIGAVAAFVWPLAIAIFLFTGLALNQWHINWIIFPITGLLFGGFAGMYGALKGE